MALRSFADGALFAEAFGDTKPKVLALHGWGRRGADYKQVLQGIPALAPDLPGFGASPPPLDVIGARGYSETILPLLDEFDRPPLVVGHSFGGRIAVCLAAAHPERVGPLLLTGVPLLRSSTVHRPAMAFRVMRSLNRVGLVSDARMEELRRSRGSADYRAATGVMRDILVKVVNESYEDELETIRSPMLLLWGAGDADVPLSVARAAEDIVRRTGTAQARVEVVEGVGHHLPVEDPDSLRRAIDSMLS